MQKKIIALAVAGLVSGAAFAQSNVTVFGIVDMGYQYSWANNTSTTKSLGKVNAGGLDGSRFGFRGTEDLGNGLKANFEMAAGYDADVGQSYGGALMSEGSWVSLSNASWGEVKAGYFGSFLDDNTGIDASGRHGLMGNGALYGTGKYTNFVAYYSPVFSGFQVKAGYSSNAINQDKAPVQDAAATTTGLNVRAYTAAASYANGGLKLGAAYASYQPLDVNRTVALVNGLKNSSEWNAGVAYNFGPVAVSLFGSHSANGNPEVIGNTYDHKNVLALGLSAPIGANDTIKVGYAEGKTYNYNGAVFANGSNKDKSKGFGAIYMHNLSKRTTAYAQYGYVKSDNALFSTGDGYKDGIRVGLRHTF